MNLKSAKTSLIVFGLYLMIVPGLGLMIVPELMLDLFGLSHGGMLWMARMIGLLAFIIGAVDYLVGKYQFKEFYK